MIFPGTLMSPTASVVSMMMRTVRSRACCWNVGVGIALESRWRNIKWAPCPRASFYLSLNQIRPGSLPTHTALSILRSDVGFNFARKCYTLCISITTLQNCHLFPTRAVCLPQRPRQGLARHSYKREEDLGIPYPTMLEPQ